MKISLQNVSKRYNREWIFKNISFEFLPGKIYAVTGPNGSGKSTLLQVIAGSILHSQGVVTYTHNGNDIEKPYPYISISAPYLELIEELTANEFLKFHFSFKNSRLGVDEMLAAVGLMEAKHKQILFFSSGMKQRLKLAQAFFSDTPVLLLDEPLTNLDKAGTTLYLSLIKEYTPNRLVVISSNDEAEYSFCDHRLAISDYK